MTGTRGENKKKRAMAHLRFALVPSRAFSPFNHLNAIILNEKRSGAEFRSEESIILTMTNISVFSFSFPDSYLIGISARMNIRSDGSSINAYHFASLLKAGCH